MSHSVLKLFLFGVPPANALMHVTCTLYRLMTAFNIVRQVVRFPKYYHKFVAVVALYQNRIHSFADGLPMHQQLPGILAATTQVNKHAQTLLDHAP